MALRPSVHEAGWPAGVRVPIRLAFDGYPESPEHHPCHAERHGRRYLFHRRIRHYLFVHRVPVRLRLIDDEGDDDRFVRLQPSAVGEVCAPDLPVNKIY